MYSGCGVAGGNPFGCPLDAGPGEGGNCPIGGYGYGPRAEDFPFRNIVTTNWRAGEIVEVGWGITANHGGGYSYRLCMLGPEGRPGLSEECFQATPLEFADDHHWIQFGEDRANRTRIPALRTREGTFPAGSHWSRNPIPACAGDHGGFLDEDDECKQGTQFAPPGPHLKGFGTHYSGSSQQFQFSIGECSLAHNLIKLSCPLCRRIIEHYFPTVYLQNNPNQLFCGLRFPIDQGQVKFALMTILFHPKIPTHVM